MAGAILETHVVIEVLKSFWHRLRQPSIYYYRDKDKKEIDILVAHDGGLSAIEVKLAATPNRRWAASFRVLEKLAVPVRGQGVACLCPEPLPLSKRA